MIDDHSLLTPEGLLNKLQQLTNHHKFVLAYSGGIDSHVLLHLLMKVKTLESNFQVRAVHVNHHISEYALEWVKHCKAICQDCSIPFDVINLDLELVKGESLEAKARDKRYCALARCLYSDECLLSAHHRDDQAETVLLQLLRGAGPKGLSAMPSCKPFAEAALLRPFLDVSKASIEMYAKQYQLSWVEDDSNQNDRFARNCLRHAVMPVLNQHWPRFKANLARAANHCAVSCDLLDELAQIDLSRSWMGESYAKIKYNPLLELSLDRQKNALRFWLTRNNCQMPQTKQLDVIIHDVMMSRHDAMPAIKIGDYQVRRYQDYLYVMPFSSYKHNVCWQECWNLTGQLKLPGNMGVLTLVHNEQYCLRSDFAWDKVQVRFRQGGEKIQLSHSNHRDSLKKLFSQWAVPPWQRGRVPLLYFDDELIVVVGYAIASGFLKKSAGLLPSAVMN